MYVCMHVCIYIYVCLYVWIYASINIASMCISFWGSRRGHDVGCGALGLNPQEPSQAHGFETYIHNFTRAYIEKERWGELRFERFSMTGRGISNIHTRPRGSEGMIFDSKGECMFECWGFIFQDRLRVWNIHTRSGAVARSFFKAFQGTLSVYVWACSFHFPGQAEGF